MAKPHIAMFAALALCSCGAAEQPKSAPTEKPTAEQICSSSQTYDTVADAIVEGIWPPNIPHNKRKFLRDAASFRQFASFSSPIVEKIDKDTGAVFCSAKISFPTGKMSMFMEAPAGLQWKLENDGIIVRAFYSIQPRADGNGEVLTVDAGNLLSEFSLKAYAISRPQEFGGVGEAPTEMRDPADSDENADSIDVPMQDELSNQSSD